MAIIDENGEIIIKKNTFGKLSIHRFKNMDEFVRKINHFDEKAGAFEFDPAFCDLSNLDFSGVEFKFHKMAEDINEYDLIDFSSCNLSNCNFSGNKSINNIILSNITADNADMSHLQFSQTQLDFKGKNVKFDDSSFENCLLSNLDLENSSFKNCRFIATEIRGGKLINCDLNVLEAKELTNSRVDISNSQINPAFYNSLLANVTADNITSKDDFDISKIGGKIKKDTQKYENAAKSKEVDFYTHVFGTKTNG